MQLIDIRMSFAVLGLVTKEAAGESDDAQAGPDKGILLANKSGARTGKRVSFADGYAPGQDSDAEPPPKKKKKKKARVRGCAWPCPASHPDHVPLWDALPPPEPPPGSPPARAHCALARCAIGIWSAKTTGALRRRRYRAGVYVQTAGSPECVAGTDVRGLTAAARLTLRGTPCIHTRAEPDTTECGLKEHRHANFAKELVIEVAVSEKNSLELVPKNYQLTYLATLTVVSHVAREAEAQPQWLRIYHCVLSLNFRTS
ncbi:hypothetical protein EVAR_46856_1 [Eumeta japonica]|uniref:Uncharacterized protein n=1 Tax=Eumeta variegata TaxID=151549 RepID=A0A4C1XPX2_EUMVA|nr:hypothetical protein EVAR_46856_1 [Eumeta japonica]